MISAITCTGFRPQAFELCADYMRRQTYKEEVQWIVVDDSPNPKSLAPHFSKLPPNIKPELYAGPEVWKPGTNTHAGNMLEALEHVKGDKILFIEDDDWYCPFYIQQMSNYLNFTDICGEGNSFYYHLKAGWKRMQNYTHASLASTGITKDLLPQFTAAVKSGNKFFDAEIWKFAHQGGKKCAIFTDLKYSVGIKGMPGRPGIGIGHKIDGYLPDPQYGILRKWFGMDAMKYISLITGKPYVPANKEGNQDNEKHAKNLQPKKGQTSLLLNDKRGEDNRRGSSQKVSQA